MITKNPWLKPNTTTVSHGPAADLVDGRVAMVYSILTAYGHELYRQGKLPEELLKKATANSYAKLINGELEKNEDERTVH